MRFSLTNATRLRYFPGMNRELNILNNVDRVGAVVSFACAVHCLALPLCLSVLPLLGLGFLASEGFEVGMIGFALLFATLSLCWGSRVHGRKHLFTFIAVALVLFSAAHEFGHDVGHSILMGLGGLLLVSAHILNRRLCKSCNSCNC